MPAPLKNKIAEYPVPEHIRSGYENELQVWIANGCFVPYPEEKLGPPRGPIPLITIVQENKDTASIILQLESIFYDQGPPAEILTDNGAAFFFRAILTAPEKLGCLASVPVCLGAGRNQHSREELPVYKSDCSQEVMFNLTSGILV